MYNKNFTLKELKNAINSCKNTSPGEDEILYEMIKKMPEMQLNKLVAYYNYLWSEHQEITHFFSVSSACPTVLPTRIDKTL